LADIDSMHGIVPPVKSRIGLAAGVAAVALGAAPAVAQEPAQAPTTPVPPAAAGAATYKLHGGLATQKMRYYAPQQEVVVRGRVTPAVPGEVLTLYAIRGEKASKTVRRKVKAGGRFEFRFRVGGPGRLRLVVKHAASAAQVAFRGPDRGLMVVDWKAGAGERGAKVLLLQRSLLEQGFATPVTGYYDDGTARAVLAFRKTNELGWDGYATTEVFAKLLRHQGAYQLRYPKAGKHVEFDWTRQVVVLAKGGKPYRTYHTSSGAPSTPTVFGTYRFYLKTPGTNAKGMVHSAYFIRGYAIHGYASVPNYPASHGCLRVPIPNAAQIFNWVDIGDPIFLYQ
jgi:L,D-transpeptidase catalytic domain/Putative peptidoglycan binding domain